MRRTDVRSTCMTPDRLRTERSALVARSRPRSSDPADRLCGESLEARTSPGAGCCRARALSGCLSAPGIAFLTSRAGLISAGQFAQTSRTDEIGCRSPHIRFALPARARASLVLKGTAKTSDFSPLAENSRPLVLPLANGTGGKLCDGRSLATCLTGFFRTAVSIVNSGGRAVGTREDRPVAL